MKYLRLILLRLAHPFLAWLGEIYPERSVTPYFVNDVTSKIWPGDVLITRENMVLTNLLIPGKFTHAAIYAGGGFITEATGVGVHSVAIEKFLFEKDFVAVLRPTFMSDEQLQKSARVASTLNGDPYDFYFTGDTKAFYCAEVVWYSYKEAMRPAYCPFSLRETWGVLTITPQDFYEATDKFELIAEFPGGSSGDKV